MLNPAKKKEIERHIQHCKQCSAKINELKKVRAGAKKLGRADCIDIDLLEKFPEKIKDKSLLAEIETHLTACESCHKELEIINSDVMGWDDLEEIEMPPINKLLPPHIRDAIGGIGSKNILYKLSKTYFHNNPLPGVIEFDKIWNTYFASIPWKEIIAKHKTKSKSNYLNESNMENKIITTFAYVLDYFDKTVDTDKLKKEEILNALKKSGTENEIINNIADYLFDNLNPVLKEKYENMEPPERKRRG